MTSEVIMVRGRTPLHGTVAVDGSNNACLPLLATAAVLGSGVRLDHVPNSMDVATMIDLLALAGWSIAKERDAVTVGAPNGLPKPSLYLGADIRASYYLVPALLAAYGAARLPWHGGHALGERGMSRQFAIYEAFGDTAEVDAGGYSVRAGTKRRGMVRILLPLRSRGATIVAVLRAVAAGRGVHVEGPNLAPETLAVLSALGQVGWRISADQRSLTASPPDTPGTPATAQRWTVPGDRIEAGTLACAIAATGGSGTVTGASTADLGALISALTRLGVNIEGADESLFIDATRTGHSEEISAVATLDPGGLDADFEPGLIVVAAHRPGRHLFADAINPGRHANLLPQLDRLGLASERVTATECRVRGPQRLSAARVEATDIRTGTALLIAGCSATGGVTVMDRAGQIRRGHPDLPGKFRALGADVEAL